MEISLHLFIYYLLKKKEKVSLFIFNAIWVEIWSRILGNREWKILILGLKKTCTRQGSKFKQWRSEIKFCIIPWLSKNLHRLQIIVRLNNFLFEINCSCAREMWTYPKLTINMEKDWEFSYQILRLCNTFSNTAWIRWFKSRIFCIAACSPVTIMNFRVP
jgi:hypothetical protein